MAHGRWNWRGPSFNPVADFNRRSVNRIRVQNISSFSFLQKSEKSNLEHRNNRHLQLFMQIYQWFWLNRRLINLNRFCLCFALFSTVNLITFFRRFPFPLKDDREKSTSSSIVLSTVKMKRYSMHTCSLETKREWKRILNIRNDDNDECTRAIEFQTIFRRWTTNRKIENFGSFVCPNIFFFLLSFFLWIYSLE